MLNFYFSPPAVPYLQRLHDIKIIRIQEIKISHLGTFKLLTRMLSISLKGHGNEADFLGFSQKLVPHESRTQPFGPFRFWLRIRGDIRIRKMTPRYHRYGESALESFKRKLSASMIRRVVDSPTQRYGESATPRINDTESRRSERQCKGLMRNQFLQKPQKIRLIAMSLYEEKPESRDYLSMWTPHQNLFL